MEGHSAHPAVCAVLARSTDRLEAALAGQSRAPQAVVRSNRFVDGLSGALESGANWIWLLDGSVAPRSDALVALLEARERADGLPEPSLLAGVVLSAGGSVDDARAAWYRRAPTETAMLAAERRLVPIRAAAGPVLVRRDAAEAEAPPRRRLAAPGAMLEWTARVLRARSGYWVPQSEHVALEKARHPARDPLAAAALLLGGAFAGVDRLRIGFDLLEQARRGVTRQGG